MITKVLSSLELRARRSDGIRDISFILLKLFFSCCYDINALLDDFIILYTVSAKYSVIKNECRFHIQRLYISWGNGFNNLMYRPTIGIPDV